LVAGARFELATSWL